MLEPKCLNKLTKFCQILTLTLYLWPSPFSCQKYSEYCNSNHVLPRKERRDRAFILTYLDSAIAEVFPHYFLSFFILAIFREKTGGQSWTKSANLGSVSFLWKLESFRGFFNNVCFARVLAGESVNVRPKLEE